MKSNILNVACASVKVKCSAKICQFATLLSLVCQSPRSDAVFNQRLLSDSNVVLLLMETF